MIVVKINNIIDEDENAKQNYFILYANALYIEDVL